MVGMTQGGHELWNPPPRTSTSAFYDDLASRYHRLYPDWDAALREQAQALDRAMGQRLGDGPLRVLDCAVGIGTQALGLALLGHQVTGTDVSEGALRRARFEAGRLDLAVPLTVADMRHLPFTDGSFDAVVCIDAVAHLSSVGEATRTFREMARVLRPGGATVVSTRDYEAARRGRLPGTLPQVNRTSTDETVAFQVWDWHLDGFAYDLTHFVLASDGPAWSVTTRAATLHAFVREELVESAWSAGLVDVEWLTPAETGFFQPTVVARRPGAGHDPASPPS